MPPRQRDARGRYISNRELESVVDLTRDSESIGNIPGGFSDLDEDPIETPLPESDSGQHESADEQENEPSVRMAPTIPAAKETKPTKLVKFDIPNLTKQNVRTWKEDVEEFCETQGVWTVVEETLRRQDNLEELRALLADLVWASQDATARYYIKRNI